MQGTAPFHHEITDALLPQPDPVVHHATALHATVDMLDAQSTLGQRLVGPFLLQPQLLTLRFLRRHEDVNLGQRKSQEAQFLRARRGFPSIRHAAIRAWNAASTGPTL